MPSKCIGKCASSINTPPKKNELAKWNLYSCSKLADIKNKSTYYIADYVANLLL